jgi:hypothetical protein
MQRSTQPVQCVLPNGSVVRIHADRGVTLESKPSDYVFFFGNSRDTMYSLNDAGEFTALDSEKKEDKKKIGNIKKRMDKYRKDHTERFPDEEKEKHH